MKCGFVAYALLVGSGLLPMVQADSSASSAPTNPQMLGMEIPLLDPANDTVRYNAGSYDVGNNALVRARFEKYLNQRPDNSKEAQIYYAGIAKILRITRQSEADKSPVKPDSTLHHTLVEIVNGLYYIADFPADHSQADVLATCMVSVMDGKRLIVHRNNQNKRMYDKSNTLVKDANQMSNSASGSRSSRNAILIQAKKDNSEALRERIDSNRTQNTATDLMLKANYQSLLLSLLMQRYFDHAVIGARVYRHLFIDGDLGMELEEDSKPAKLFSELVGTSPTVNAVDSIANTARADIDDAMEAVRSLLIQNKLGEATQRLIEAVAVGERMQSVVTFPTESRLRIAEYWSLRKRLLTSMNARDYAVCLDIAKKMTEKDADFDDSQVKSYCTAKIRESDLNFRNAMTSLRRGEDEQFLDWMTKAVIVWPRNPKIEKGEEMLVEFDSNDLDKQEFLTLYKRKAYRTIYDEQDRFDVVCSDVRLKIMYKDAIQLVATMDAILAQLSSFVAQDRTMGPCLAYETLMERMEEEPRFANDEKYKGTIADYAIQAHGFVQALRDAEDSEKRAEIGSAMSSYYHALAIYPGSKYVAKKVKRLRDIIMSAKF